MAVAIPKGTIIVVAPECVSGQRMLDDARAAGCRVVSAVAAPPEQDAHLRWNLVTNPDHPGTCDRLVWRPDYASLESDLADEKDVVAVVAGSEFGVEAAERLAERFGVRGNPAATSAQRRNKFAMKTAIAAAGLDHAKGALVRTAEKALAYVRESLAYPVIAKPPDSAGALNVFKCRDEGELKAALGRILSTPDGYGKVPREAIVEEYIPGDEYVVNLFGDADKLAVTSVWRYEWVATPYCHHCYWNEFMLDPSDPDLADLCAYAKKVYRAVGIRWGSAHAEIKRSPRGPVVMEIGARIMGGAYETFADEGMCLDMPLENLKVFATGRSDVPAVPRLREHLALATLPYVTEGVVTAVRGMGEIRRLPTYLCETIPVKPGDRIAPSRYLDECVCYVWLKAGTLAELERDLAVVHREFRVETA